MAVVIAKTYELLEKIGSGGGGVVYLARHLRLNKKVVLKADKRKITTRDDVLRREVDALKDLNHTYIPQVYDYFCENNIVYTVIDYVEGESLDKPLKRGEKFTQAQVIKWAYELLEALCYLHKPVHGTPPRGIVHSDIKPANIMLTPEGDIKLIDFNIALALGEENVVGLSAGYASPEHYGLNFSSGYNGGGNSSYGISSVKTQADSGEDEIMVQETVTMSMKASGVSTSGKRVVIPDARSDIYSLGASLYHLLSGKRPAKNALEVEPLSEKEFSPQIVKIITKAMSPDPDMRYQSADEMLDAVIHLRENDPRTIKRRRTFIFASMLFVFLMGASVAVSFTGLKRMETLQKNMTLAEYSANAFEEGNIDRAKEYALEALDNKGIFSSGYIPQAQKALADAMGVYDLSDGYKAEHIVEIPGETFKIAISPDGTKGAAVYAYEVALFNTETGKVTGTLPVVKSALADAVFIGNDKIVYGGREGLTLYDIENKTPLWTKNMATQIAVSADGNTIASVFRDESFATVYDINGNIRATVDFGGRKQRVVSNDTFADPEDNVMALNRNGKYLAATFDDGGVYIYDIENPEDTIEIYDKSDYIHFEGGFKDKYFVFSGTNEKSSEFASIDVEGLIQTIGFTLDSPIGVKASEDGVYICNKSTAVEIDPLTGEQREAAYTDADIKTFDNYKGNTVVLTGKNEYLVYDYDGDMITRYNGGQAECSFAAMGEDHILGASIDTSDISILKKSTYDNTNMCNYDKDYVHDEARINEDETRVMLFNYKGFRIYDTDGNMISDVILPNPENVYDQQYSKKSGNLAVMYSNAFRLYSGNTGELIYEAEGLKSVFYAKYGISIFDGKEVKLIDIDRGDVIESVKTEGSFGALCGMTVNDNVLDGGRLIGAFKSENGYIFAIDRDGICFVYDEKGNKMFEVPAGDNSEAFFTENGIIISPLHGTPEVYNLNNGKKINDMEENSYLTYVTETDEYIVSEYMWAEGGYYAMLLDKKSYEPVAYVPDFTDLSNDNIIYDYDKGILCKSRIYSIEELINMAKGGE